MDRLGDGKPNPREYFIYEGNYALYKPELRIIQDPVGKGIEPEEVVEYRIAAAVLTEHATTAVWPGVEE